VDTSAYRDVPSNILLDYVAKGDQIARLEYYIRRRRRQANARKLINH
jgi:hypothetical protein